MNAGTTFLLAKEHEVIDNHLWIVLSDAGQFPDRVVLVSVTTLAPEKDQACLIDRGEHPWITHASCVSYAHAKVVSLAFLLDRKDKGSIMLQEAVTPELLERIRRSSVYSTTLPLDIADILIEQGIINLDE
jgi:hypothetical protein